MFRLIFSDRSEWRRLSTQYIHDTVQWCVCRKCICSLLICTYIVMVLVAVFLYNVFESVSNGDSDCSSSCTLLFITQYYTVLHAMVMYHSPYCIHYPTHIWNEHYPTDQLMSIFNDICNIRSYKEYWKVWFNGYLNFYIATYSGVVILLLPLLPLFYVLI